MADGKVGAYELARETLLRRYGTLDPDALTARGADGVEIGAARNIAKWRGPAVADPQLGPDRLAGPVPPDTESSNLDAAIDAAMDAWGEGGQRNRMHQALWAALDVLGRPDGTTPPPPSLEVSAAIALAERLVYARIDPAGREVDASGALLAYVATLPAEQLAHVEAAAAALVYASLAALIGMSDGHRG